MASLNEEAAMPAKRNANSKVVEIVFERNASKEREWQKGNGRWTRPSKTILVEVGWLFAELVAGAGFEPATFGL